MTGPTKPYLPIDLNLAQDQARSPRRWFRKRYLLVLLVPVFMFSGAVLGMYFQPPGLQKFYALTGLQPGGRVCRTDCPAARDRPATQNGRNAAAHRYRRACTRHATRRRFCGCGALWLG